MQSDLCKATGKCTSRDGECVVGSDADCQRSALCDKAGRCVKSDDRCVR